MRAFTDIKNILPHPIRNSKAVIIKEINSKLKKSPGYGLLHVIKLWEAQNASRESRPHTYTNQ